MKRLTLINSGAFLLGIGLVLILLWLLSLSITLTIAAHSHRSSQLLKNRMIPIFFSREYNYESAQTDVDLSASRKTVNRDQAAAGEVLTYTIMLTNSGIG